MTANSSEYLDSTDSDIELWYHTRVANNKLESLMRGYDIEDEKLIGSELGKKYTTDVLEQKARKFSELTVKEQKGMVMSSVTGKITGIAKQVKEAPIHIFLIAKVRSYMVLIKKMGKLNEWIDSASGVTFDMFCGLPVVEKQKYGNALIAYHDRCMEKKGRPLPKQILDSSPTAGGGRPDFDDKSKWDQV